MMTDEDMAAVTRASTPAQTPVALFARRASAYAAIVFLALVGALHVLKPDLDPSWRVISESAIGPCGWLLVLAFLAPATQLCGTYRGDPAADHLDRWANRPCGLAGARR